MSCPKTRHKVPCQGLEPGLLDPELSKGAAESEGNLFLTAQETFSVTLEGKEAYLHCSLVNNSQ